MPATLISTFLDNLKLNGSLWRSDVISLSNIVIRRTFTVVRFAKFLLTYFWHLLFYENIFSKKISLQEGASFSCTMLICEFCYCEGWSIMELFGLSSDANILDIIDWLNFFTFLFIYSCVGTLIVFNNLVVHL